MEDWKVPESDENAWRDHYNPYSEPEKCGLEIIETTSEPNLCYEFHDLILWRDKASGKLYWAEDSGCSCPIPFENYRSLDDLTEYEKTKDEYERRKQLVAAGRGWED